MKYFYLLFFMLLQLLTVSANPVLPGQWRILNLEDGSQVEAELKGDEFCHFWQTADGRCFVETSTAGVYQPAILTDLQNRSFNNRKANIEPAKRRTRTIIGGDHQPYVGKKKGLLLLVDFQNKKFEDDHTPDLYKDIANKVGFTSDLGFVGSMKDYFMAQSGDQFELEFDVVGPLTMPKTYGYYGANTQGNDTNPRLMIGTACEMADEYVNFKDYDWDDDGEVDLVYVIYAGLGEAAGGDANTIWPHKSALHFTYGDPLQFDGVKVDTYACGPELTVKRTYTGTKTIIEGIGTICHEFSHCLGLPDVYDTSYGGGYGMDAWDLMNSGSYNGDSYIPAGYTSYEKFYCGWLQPIELKNDTTITGMKPLSEGGEAYIIYNDANRNEYYLLENRQLTGWDAAIPGHGLLVIHVDYDSLAWQYNFVNNYTSYPKYNNHERLTVIAADNNRSSSDAATDAYPYQDNNSLTNISLPRAELYNLNPDGIHYTSKPITNIKEENGLISFEFKNEVKNRSSETAIRSISSASDKRKTIYNLQGRDMGTNPSALPKGIYIIDGKKVVK